VFFVSTSWNKRSVSNYGSFSGLTALVLAVLFEIGWSWGNGNWWLPRGSTAPMLPLQSVGFHHHLPANTGFPMFPNPPILANLNLPHHLAQSLGQWSQPLRKLSRANWKAGLPPTWLSSASLEKQAAPGPPPNPSVRGFCTEFLGATGRQGFHLLGWRAAPALPPNPSVMEIEPK
jgi:hypothetical protein